MTRPSRPSAPRERSAFTRAVRAIVRAIPEGRTLSYGAVAARAGHPGAARAVVRVLRSLEDLPWWRVVRADGSVAPLMRSRQLPLLEAEAKTAGAARSGRRPLAKVLARR